MECTEPSQLTAEAQGLTINDTGEQGQAAAARLGNTNVEAVQTDKSNNSSDAKNISPSQNALLDDLWEQIKSGEAKLGKDKNGKTVIDYKFYKEQTVLNWDPSNTNKLYVPQEDHSKKKQQDMMEAVMEQLDFYHKHKFNAGIVFDPSKVKSTRRQIYPSKSGLYEEGVDFEKTTRILGEGGIAGKILLIKDKVTGSEMAQKTVAICSFHEEELRCWVDLQDTDYPPCLYIYQVKGGNVEIFMEPIENAITLDEICEKCWIQNEKNRRSFSLYMFDSLLTAVQTLNKKGWTHGDLHTGNIMVDCMTKIRILDFGQAKRLDDVGGLQNFRRDIEEIVRKFTLLYLGNHFGSAGDIRKDSTRQEGLNMMADVLEISPEVRKEIFTLIDRALSIVMPSEVTTFQKDLRKMLPEQHEMDKIMKEVIAILFPDQYQNIHEPQETRGLSSMDGSSSRMEDRTVADSIDFGEPDLEPVTDDVLQMFRQNVRIG